MTYTSGNRLATYNEQPIEYDADGNMLTGPLQGKMSSLAYDSRNRLISAGDLGYQYDAENNRIGVIDNIKGTQTSYVVNPNTVLSQALSATDVNGTTYYVYGLGLIGQENPDGTYQTYHYDLRGSTVALTDQTGKVTDRYQYGPYGEMVKHDGKTSTPFQYGGQYGVMTDANGLNYMRARYYSPEIRRFINQDILIGGIDDSRSLNRFVYVNGQPVDSADPFGLCPDKNNSRILIPNTNISGLLAYNGTPANLLASRLPDEECFFGGDDAAEGALLVAYYAVLALGAYIGVQSAEQQREAIEKRVTASIEALKEKAETLKGPPGIVYSLRATVNGNYPNVRGGTTYLNIGDVWRYGETTDQAGRYSRTELRSDNLAMFPEFEGNQYQCKAVEKYLILEYWKNHKWTLPPGNKIFR